MGLRKVTPDRIFDALEQSIIGQGDYLYDLSVAIWLHHLRREHYMRTGQTAGLPKYNMLVIGKSGMGKTSAIQAAAELLDIPVVIEDASQLRGSGWKGKNVSEIVRDIHEAATAKNAGQDAAEFSIVVLDEIDKIFSGSYKEKSFYPTDNLLKFMEGTECSCGGEHGAERIQMPTHNLLFICTGAFDGLEETIRKRIEPKPIGFSSPGGGQEPPERNILKEATPEDLAAYGMGRQFLGRLPIISVMNELSQQDYEDILLKSEISPVKQLGSLLRYGQGVALSITQKAATELAERAKGSGLGARALQHEIISIMKNALFDMPETEESSAYRIDYRDSDGFSVWETEGERASLSSGQFDVPFKLSEKERQNLQRVRLDTIPQEADSIQVYAERMFELYEDGRFSEYPPRGLADIYGYMDIRRAVFIAAAAIAQLFMDSGRSSAGTNMLQLLDAIQELPLPTASPFLPPERTFHPLERHRNLFLQRLSQCTMEQAEDIRGIAWIVVHKYAKAVYRLDFGAEDGGCLD